MFRFLTLTTLPTAHSGGGGRPGPQYGSRKHCRGVPLAQLSMGWTEFPSVSGDVNMCAKGKTKKAIKKKVWKTLAFYSSHLEIHIACLHIKGSEDSCNTGTCVASFDPVFPIFTEHRPCCLDTLRSILGNGVLQTISLGNSSNKNWQTFLHSISCFSHRSPLASLPSTVDADQPKHLHLVLSWTGSLKTASA